MDKIKENLETFTFYVKIAHLKVVNNTFKMVDDTIFCKVVDINENEYILICDEEYPRIMRASKFLDLLEYCNEYKEHYAPSSGEPSK